MIYIRFDPVGGFILLINFILIKLLKILNKINFPLTKRLKRKIEFEPLLKDYKKTSLDELSNVILDDFNISESDKIINLDLNNDSQSIMQNSVEESIKNQKLMREHCFRIDYSIDVDSLLGNLKEDIENKKYNQYFSNISYSTYLQDLMKEKGIRQRDIYNNSCDMSKSHISKIINGRNGEKSYIPSQEVLLKLSFIMELSIHETVTLLKLANRPFNQYNHIDCVYIFLLKNKYYDPAFINDFLRILNYPELFKKIN